MVGICSDVLVVSALLLVVAAGCSRGGGEQTERKSAATNSVVSTEIAIDEPTEERKRLQQAREFLDKEEYALAMRTARGLLGSKDEEVLSGLVDIFGWIGRKAMPELEELIDKPQVSTQALDAWERAVEEIGGENAKIFAVTNAASKFSDATVIDTILMHIIDIDSDKSLRALEGLVLGQTGKAVSERAKSMFEHVSGEPYSSPERTMRLMKERSDGK